MDFTPDHIGRMDESLRTVWVGLNPLPEGWCLAGGTALMLYLDHRSSTDLDWYVPNGDVDLDKVRCLSSFDGLGELVRIKGGKGMVDCVLRPFDLQFREIEMSFLGEHRGFFPQPRLSPKESTNPSSTLVLHPVDLAACKLMTILTRAAKRDFEDIGALANKCPDILQQAIKQLEEFEGIDLYECLLTMVTPPDDISLSESLKKELSEFASKLSPK